jgi:hypothetical protein
MRVNARAGDGTRNYSYSSSPIIACFAPTNDARGGTLESVRDAADRCRDAPPLLIVLVGREIEPGATEPVDTPEPQAHASLRPDVREAHLRLQATERIPDIAVSNTTPVNNDALPPNIASAGSPSSYEPLRGGAAAAS